MDSLHTDLCILTAFRSVLLRRRNVSEESYSDNLITHFTSQYCLYRAYISSYYL